MFNNRCQFGHGKIARNTISFVFHRYSMLCHLDDSWRSRLFGKSDYSYLTDGCVSSVFVFHQVVRM